MADEPGSTDPAPQPAEPAKPAEPGGAKGEPDLKAQNSRLSGEVATYKAKVESLQGQITTLNASLEKALTEDDVKTAVEQAKADMKEASDAAESKWAEDRKRLTVENAVTAAGCADTVGLLAHIDMSKVDVASDGHLSGIDLDELKKSYPHLFKAAQTYGSAAAPGGPAKKMTREEIDAISDRKERQAAIASHLELYK